MSAQNLIQHEQPQPSESGGTGEFCLSFPEHFQPSLSSAYLVAHWDRSMCVDMRHLHNNLHSLFLTMMLKKVSFDTRFTDEEAGLRDKAFRWVDGVWEESNKSHCLLIPLSPGPGLWRAALW